jgi:hypothetical protein
MAQQSFSATIDAWVAQTEGRLLAVFQTSTQFVIEDVIARTPVDTGFLRASLVVSANGPVPMSRTPDAGGSLETQSYDLAIAGAGLGSAIYATFGAVYAAHVEYGAQGRAGRGMVRLAAQAWPQHVERATELAKSRAG